MTLTDKYRHIKLTATLDTNSDEAIRSLNGWFNQEDFYAVRNGDSLELWLRQLDLSRLAQAIEVVSGQFGNYPLLAEVQEAVERIGSYGVNGNKRLFVGFNRERKVVNRKDKEEKRGKHYYANHHDFVRDEYSVPPRLIDQVVCGDSEAVLKDLPDNCIDLVFTSPPYNFGLSYHEKKDDDTGDWNPYDTGDWDSYFHKLFKVFDECIRVLKYGGRIIVNVQPLFSDYIPSHHIISNYFMKQGLIWKGEILWEKNNYNCKYTAWGSWKSPSSPYLKYTWEFLEIFCKGNLKKPGYSANADIDAESFKEWVMAKWSIAPERRMREFDHPAMFPEELARRAMLLFSFQGDIVLDPFMGVGTTCVVARSNNRHYLGVDIAPEYCATATQRLTDIQLRGF